MKRLLWPLLFGGMVLGWMLYQEQGKEVSGLPWGTYSFLGLGLAILMVVLRDFFYVWRIRVLTDQQLSWKQCIRVILTWEFTSALTPGVVGGSAVAMFILHREKIPLGKSTAIVMITAILDNLFYLLLVPTFILLFGSDQLLPEELLGPTIGKRVHTLFWLGYGVLACIALGLAFAVLIRPVFSRKMLNRLFRLKFLRRWQEKAKATGNEIVQTAVELRKKNIRYWALSFVATLLSWSSRFLIINCILLAFGVVHWNEQVLAYMRQFGLWIVLLITPTPGASGGAEFMFSELFQDMLTPGTSETQLALVWRLISYYPYLFVGALFVWRWYAPQKKNG